MVPFKLPEVAGGSEWLRLVDTNQPERTQPTSFRAGDEYETTGRSLLLFQLKLGERLQQPVRVAVEAIVTTAAEPAQLDLTPPEPV